MSVSEIRRTGTEALGQARDPAALADRLAPFVAWLATRLDDEAARRHCREVVADFLDWAEGDRGDPRTRHGRYRRHSAAVAPDAVRGALALFAEHNAVVAVTLSLDD